MGWTFYNIERDEHGRVPVKKECDRIINAEPSKCVLASSMHGSTYYAAVKDYDSNSVFGMVILTQKGNDLHGNFGFKAMNETCGPYYYDCSQKILDLLTPTNDLWANEWREGCKERLEQKRKAKEISKLLIGTVIKTTIPYDMEDYCKGEQVVLTKLYLTKAKSAKWVDRVKHKYFASTFVAKTDYTIVKKGK